MTAKQCEEMDLAARLFSALGRTGVRLESSDRPDVIAHVDGLRVGIEVTQFHADERSGAKGSSLRATEGQQAKLAGDRPYAMSGEPNPQPGVIARINDKVSVAAAYDSACYDRLWLLISGGLPKMGAVVSTYAIPAFVDVAELNRSTHALLSGASFSTVYLHLLLPAALFCWSREEKWQAIHTSNA